VLSTKNSVQVNNYGIYKALNVPARPFVESRCDMLQRHDDCMQTKTKHEDTPNAKRQLGMFIRFQSGSSY
jgi:hypothetical protein